VAPEALKAGWETEVDRNGGVSAIGEPVTENAGAGAFAVRIPVTLDSGQLTVIVGVSADGWLTGLHLAPASASAPAAPWEPPAYADPTAFVEQAVTVGSGPLAVPGSLCVPPGSDRRAAVVMLAGSGPSDRDGTVGRMKPLKDIAWGLATLGVVVLRFDKVTYAHRDIAAAMDAFTLADEYVTDAAAAIGLLRQHASVDPGRVFVLGHSLGGTVAPRVAAQEPSVAGLVIFAGGAQPLHWSAVRQMRYLASLNPATQDAARATIDALAEQATIVDSPGLSEATPAVRLPFGVPAPYWLDLRAYDPVATAATVGKPMLILQGGRDYQATVDDDLALWRAGLGDRANVTIRVYDDDNHLFAVGSGKSTPADYETPHHVDPAVVTDIASWLAHTTP
ncbi:MAG TPA: alpha/beta fold hydrolase, partial [Micromonosporaceae bacterium]